MLRIDILTIFPDMLNGVFSEGILRIAQEKKLIEVHSHNIRDYSTNKHAKTDDRPFGGGPGMVMTAQPVIDSVRAVQNLVDTPTRLIFLGPEGKRFNQVQAEAFSIAERLIFVCGRYEGFDQRIFDILQPEIYSIGDFILTGGELAAAVIIDATARLIPGALGKIESAQDESFSLKFQGKQLLDYPHYTHPTEYEGLSVPEILRGGNHKHINEWRLHQAYKKTKKLRPDLLE